MCPLRLPNDDLEHIVAHTRDAWEAVRGGRVFLSGGTGFFGMWLVESFLHANEALKLDAEMIVLSRDPATFLEREPHLSQRGGLSFLAGDVGSFPFLAGRLSHVIHAATERYHPESGADRLTVFERDLQGTRRVLELARHGGAKGFLLTSSGAVYGRQPPEVSHVGEDYPGAPHTMNPDAGYAHAKRVSELLCAMYFRRYGLASKIARCFAFVGPHLPLDAGFAIGNFLRDGLRGGPIVVQGDGTPHRSYLYAADLAVWLWTILLKGECCAPYNVGSEEAISIADVAHTVAACFQPPPEVRIMQTATPGKAAERYVPSTRRAELGLQLRALIGLREAVLRTIRWHSHHHAFKTSQADGER